MLKYIILEYFNAAIRSTDEDKLYEALLSKDTDSAAKQLHDLMKRTISYYDTKLFITDCLPDCFQDYRVESNCETGDGRSDIILYQEGYEDNAIILELKACKKQKIYEFVQQMLLSILTQWNMSVKQSISDIQILSNTELSLKVSSAA